MAVPRPKLRVSSNLQMKGVEPRRREDIKLHGEQDEESHHQTEQTHGLRQSEAQNGVGKELLFQGRIPVNGEKAI